MTESINPFESSFVDSEDRLREPYAGPRRPRPYAPLWIGIAGCVIGGLGLLNAVMHFTILYSGSTSDSTSRDYGLYAALFSHPWTPHVDRGVHGFLDMLLIAGGIGLINYKDWGRRWLVRYAALSIVAIVFLTVYLFMSLVQEIPIAYLEWGFVTATLAQLHRTTLPVALLLVISRPRFINSLS